ncbi:MAG: PLP-dependent aminotransferase family protein [Planctomycetes bacterium]|nr:PLP-dependent aminotransferase family protein [Planctomycetota bacterium]
MLKWDFPLELDPASRKPIFIQISQAIVEGVKSGRLRPGASLPGTRTLAATLGVHRNTIVAAYDELLAEGWIMSSPARGMFVSSAIPEFDTSPFVGMDAHRRPSERLGFPLRTNLKEVGPLHSAPGTINMGSRPDFRLAPRAALARAYRRALSWSPEAVLGYADPKGNVDLRRALAAMLASTRGMATEPNDVIVTRGSQMALYLAAFTLLKPGDEIAVEALGYPPAWEAFRQAGGRLIPVPVDDEGMCVDALDALSKRKRLRAVYVTPHHQFPTMVTLTAGRRLALLEFARRRRIAVIEDDYDHEFHYRGRPVLPLASIDRWGVVIYIGTLSKVLAPGLRVGYVVAPRPVLEQIATRRIYLDHQGDHALERALADLMEDGEVQRHLRRAQKIYQARQSFMVRTLKSVLEKELSFKIPPGGTDIWAKVASGIDPETWAARAAKRGVLFRPGAFFAVDGRPRPFIRLGYGGLDEKEIKEAVSRLAAAL